MRERPIYSALFVLFFHSKIMLKGLKNYTNDLWGVFFKNGVRQRLMYLNSMSKFKIRNSLIRLIDFKIRSQYLASVLIGLASLVLALRHVLFEFNLVKISLNRKMIWT